MSRCLAWLRTVLAPEHGSPVLEAEAGQGLIGKRLRNDGVVLG
jgi:hypothetical protein